MSNAPRVKVLLDFMEEQGFSALECKFTAHLLLGTCMSVPLVIPYRLEGGPDSILSMFGPPAPTGTVRAENEDWAGYFTGYSKKPGALHVVAVFEPFNHEDLLNKEKQDGPDEPSPTPA